MHEDHSKYRFEVNHLSDGHARNGGVSQTINAT